MIKYFIPALFLLTISCTTRQLSHNIKGTAITIAIIPVAIVAGTYGCSRRCLQKIAILCHFPVNCYSSEKSSAGIKRGINSRQKLGPRWRYMGTRRGYHFMAVDPFIGLRRIVRVYEDEYLIDYPDPLSSVPKNWCKLEREEKPKNKNLEHP
ncbi:MAG: hypothetical protein HRT89_11655 [Lentisphaeria bacterium]|nr:hypothetical protein [Lentisphaeria bacterium]NQZ68711.1 hypothetical protein [Lentisphaeria bacterium]